jgi:hypothetical protein
VTIDRARTSGVVQKLDASSLTVEGAKVRDALATTLAASDDSVLRQSAVRELGRFGARVPNTGSLLTMPSVAAGVLVGGTHAQLSLRDSTAPGCLLLRIVRREARELGVDTPNIDKLMARVGEMQAKRSTSGWWFTSVDPSHAIDGLQRDGEVPSHALRRAVTAVHRLHAGPDEPEQEVFLGALVKETVVVAHAAMKSEKWEHIASAMRIKCRGARGVNAGACRQRALAGAWTMLCNTLVDRLLCEVEMQLEQTGRSVACVDGRDPTMIKLVVTKSDASLPTLTTMAQVRLGVKPLELADNTINGLVRQAAHVVSDGSGSADIVDATALREHVAAVVRDGDHDALTASKVRAAVEGIAGIEPDALRPRRREIATLIDEVIRKVRTDAAASGSSRHASDSDSDFDAPNAADWASGGDEPRRVLESVCDEDGRQERRVADPDSHEDRLAAVEAHEAERMGASSGAGGGYKTLQAVVKRLEAHHQRGEQSGSREGEESDESSSESDEDGQAGRPGKVPRLQPPESPAWSPDLDDDACATPSSNRRKRKRGVLRDEHGSDTNASRRRQIEASDSED